MVVVVLMILMAIALPITGRLIDRGKASNTLATMQVVENAMSIFASERPLAGNYAVLCPQDPTSSVSSLFGTLPPSPLSRYSLRPAPGGGCHGPSLDDTPDTWAKLYDPQRGLMRACLPDFSGGGPAGTVVPPNNRYMSIESLTLYLRMLSPGARQVIDKLPDRQRSNLDQDNIRVHVPQEMPADTDLFEISDAWGRPMRYFVQVPFADASGIAAQRRWELRSAGADGVFGDGPEAGGWLTPPEESQLPAAADDVVMIRP